MGDVQRPRQYPEASAASTQAFADRVRIPGTKLFHAHIFNKGAARFVMLFDKPMSGSGSSVSTGVSSGFYVWQIGASNDLNIEYQTFPWSLQNGMLFLESATATSYTSGASNLLIQVLYG